MYFLCLFCLNLLTLKSPQSTSCLCVLIIAFKKHSFIVTVFSNAMKDILCLTFMIRYFLYTLSHRLYSFMSWIFCSYSGLSFNTFNPFDFMIYFLLCSFSASRSLIPEPAWPSTVFMLKIKNLINLRISSSSLIMRSTSRCARHKVRHYQL